MATLTLFRKKSIPSDSEYGDDVRSYQGAGSTIVSENLTEQIQDGKYLYRTSVDFKEKTTSLFLNGLYMTMGVDYDELGTNNIVFIGGYADDPFSTFTEDNTIISIEYVAK
jgi:hypothetical protein